MILLAVVFALIHSPSGDRAVKYQNVDVETAKKLASDLGTSYQIIDQATYDAFIQARPAPTSVIADPQKRADKVILNNVASTDSQKLNAVIDLLDLKS